MITVKVKPLSVNEAYRGRRFKAQAYLNYEKDVTYLLPNKLAIPPKIELHYIFGLSSPRSDLGNCEKIITDILCKTYGFDDKNVYKIVMSRIDVKKGEEFVGFDILEFIST